MVGLVLESLRLRTHHAETLPGGRFHDPPGLKLLNTFCAQGLESAHFRFDIVGFDIQVHSTRMRHRLDFHVQSLAGINQLHILRSLFSRESTKFHAQGAAPKRRGGLHIVGLTIDDEPRQPALVHDCGSLF